MAWGIGANDVANAMAPSVGAGALTVGGAILIAGAAWFVLHNNQAQKVLMVKAEIEATQAELDEAIHHSQNYRR